MLIIATFMCIPMFIALHEGFVSGEYNSFKSFLYSIILIIIFSGTMFLINKNRKIDFLSYRDGFMFVTLSWVTASFFGGLPFYFSGAMPNFADAYFETMSGFTTTGASILTSIETLPHSLLFWRSLTHWLGGMGIVVLTVAILPILGIGGLQLIKAEAPGPSMDKITPRITETAKYLWLIYLSMTIIETALLMFGGMDLFNALTHTFGTLATGGFSPKNSSVGHFDSAYIHVVITVFMVMAGVNFSLYYKILSGKAVSVFKDNELRAYLVIFLIFTTLIAINLNSFSVYNIPRSFQFASFQVASILTTTGYATANFENWPHVAQILLFLLMFIGGCSGSTGGGIKVIRIITLFKKGLNEMKYLLHPSGVFALKVGKANIRKDIAYSISAFFFLYIMMLLVTTFIVATSDVDIVTSLTTALATVGNIGPGFGLIGPSDNYNFYPDYVKWFLSFAMMVGRLELYTVLVLFSPVFWKNK